MKLYPIPGGTWAGTEAEWKAGMKALGLNPKEFEASKTREVPTGKKELMEFLTFFAVDPYRLASGTTVSQPAVDVEALRRQHNPDAVVDMGAAVVGVDDPTMFHGDQPDTPDYSVPGTLEREFINAPIRLQSQMVVGFIDRLTP